MRTGKFVVLALVLLGVIAGVLVWQLGTPRELTYTQAVSQLDSLLKRVSWSESIVTRKATVVRGKCPDLQHTLPDISKFDLVVNPTVASGEVAVEIFASVEKAGKGFDGWLVEVANDFNRSNLRLRNGQSAKVKIRAIASGEGYQFIAAQKYLPDAYSPSHVLWMNMLAAKGIALTPISERLLGDVAGIVMKERVWRTLQSKYGTVEVKHVLDAVAQGSIAMGYTDPFVSSAGLNFLVTVLATFAQGDPGKMLADDVVSAFRGVSTRGALCRPDDTTDARFCPERRVARGIYREPRRVCESSGLPVGIRLYPLWHPARQSALRHWPAHQRRNTKPYGCLRSSPRRPPRKSWRRSMDSISYPTTRPPLRLPQARCSLRRSACGSARKMLDALSWPSFLGTSVVPWKACRSVTLNVP